jgi:hypothetical protein
LGWGKPLTSRGCDEDYAEVELTAMACAVQASIDVKTLEILFLQN